MLNAFDRRWDLRATRQTYLTQIWNTSSWGGFWEGYRVQGMLTRTLSRWGTNPIPERVTLTRADAYAQAMVKGLTLYSNGMGAISLKNDLPLESRGHLTELSKNIEMINRYFQISYDENTSTNYCHKCLTVEGSTPTHWKTQLELCGYNAMAARESITNQFIQSFHTQMCQWYESQRAAAHEQIVLKITNDNFAPDLLTADPRIIEWSNRAYKNAHTRRLLAVDTKAKQDAEDHYQTALTQYGITHDNDLAQAHDDYQQAYLRMKNDYNIKLSEAEAQFQKEYKEMIENGKANRPIVVDLTARKKRRGSVSTINSPIITKSQPINLPTIPIPITSNPDPGNVPFPPNPQPTTTRDPMAQILDMMSKQFEKLTDRLDKLEATNKDTHTTSWDNDDSTSWKQPENDLALAATRFEDPYIANMDYDNADLYDDPPNDHSFVGESDTHTIRPPVADEPPSQHDSDCILLSGPPTPTAPQPAPSGLRPPECAQRVDFVSGKLATDSFGIPVEGHCNSDGTISFSNANPTRNKPKKPLPSLPEHLMPYSNAELHKVSKDAIISHALFLFQEHISRNWQKPQVIQRYLTLAANARKPGARQSTLSFAAVANKPQQPAPGPRQTTPSAWSKSPSPPPRRPIKPTSNNTTWIIHPRMGTMGLTSRPFDGNADKLTEWYRKRLEANAGPSKPMLTLIRGAWANGPKSIFSLTFAGHITIQTI